MRPDGLTETEGNVMDALIDAYGWYGELQVQHEDEPGEFTHHIHMLQGLLACRIARRCYPEGWPTYAMQNHQGSPQEAGHPQNQAQDQGQTGQGFEGHQG